MENDAFLFTWSNDHERQFISHINVGFDRHIPVSQGKLAKISHYHSFCIEKLCLIAKIAVFFVILLIDRSCPICYYIVTTNSKK